MLQLSRNAVSALSGKDRITPSTSTADPGAVGTKDACLASSPGQLTSEPVVQDPLAEVQSICHDEVLSDSDFGLLQSAMLPNHLVAFG